MLGRFELYLFTLSIIFYRLHFYKLLLFFVTWRWRKKRIINIIESVTTKNDRMFTKI